MTITKEQLKFSLLAATLALTWPAAGQAGGELDFLDPCKQVEKEFDSTSSALRTRSDEIIAEWDKTLEPPG
jgi:hypothetical protein